MAKPADFALSWFWWPCILSTRTPSQLYPKRRYRGKQENENRVVFLEFYGGWPKNFACHRCDNPRCIEPRHLFDGTHEENMADGVNKSRFRRGRNHPAFGKGAALRRMVIALYKAEVKQTQIADFLCVNPDWVRHVTMEFRRSARA